MIYPTLTPASHHALDVYEEAAYVYQMAHTEQNRVALEAAREAMLRAVISDAIRDHAPSGAAPNEPERGGGDGE